MPDSPSLLSMLSTTPSASAATAANQPGAPSAAQAAWLVLAAHVVELRAAGVIDDRALQALALALQWATDAPVSKAESAQPRPVIQNLVTGIESRLPGAVSGLTTLGLSMEESLATSARIVWRNVLLAILRDLVDVSTAVQTLAETHVVTIMPAYSGGQPAQPTTLAHFLGGVAEPLRDGRHHMQQAFARINRSPLGAGMLAGDVVGADRADLADRLGFTGILGNTLDALGSVEDVVATLDAITSSLAAVTRFVRELRQWIRTDPTSFVMDEPWLSIPEAGHPSLQLALRLDTLQMELEGTIDRLNGYRQQLRRQDYGPLGAGHDLAFAAAIDAGTTVPEVLATVGELFRTGIVVNRAYLGNRAGRHYTTAPDLAAFLMTEEQIAPTAAQHIAVLVLSRLKDMHLEVSGITPDMIDSAALMTIGREIKVEMETLGRFLAPRRYIERRQVAGSPAPDMTREWLQSTAAAIAEDDAWLSTTAAALHHARESLMQAIDSVAADEQDN